MIGDWVRINRDGLCIKKGTIVEVRGIDGDNKFPEKDLQGVADCRPLDKSQFQGGIWCEYLDPIPLTPEILEKNGFGYFSIGGAENWYIKDDYYNLHICEWSDSIWVLRYDSTEMNIPCTKVTFSYIHELQHALRLCGIEKEIHI